EGKEQAPRRGPHQAGSSLYLALAGWLPEGQALPLGSLDGEERPHTILDLAGVPAEVEFREVAVQVIRADVVERAVDPPLQEPEVALHCVRGHVASGVLPDGVVNL